MVMAEHPRQKFIPRGRMKPFANKILLSTLLFFTFLSLTAAPPAQAQGNKSLSGVGFSMSTRFWAPVDPRFDAGSSVIRLHFQASDSEYLFHEKEDATLTFQNTGSGAITVAGNVSTQGIGFGMVLGTAMRFELMAGRASTYINNGTLVSSDSVFNLGLFYTYKPAKGAYLDLGMLYRQHRLSNTLPGNVVDLSGVSSTDPVDDLGAVMLNLGLGFGF